MIITEKNMNMVAGRLRKFFNSDRYFREWHNFRGGLKPRIKHNYFEGERIENYYYNVSTRMNRYGSAFIVDLNSDEADVFTVGDTVLFKGNRVIHKSVMPMRDTRYCYTCYQIITKSDPDYDKVANYAESSKHYADMYFDGECCDRFDDEFADAEDKDDSMDKKYVVLYTDNTGANDSEAEYSSAEEAEIAIEEELNEMKKAFTELGDYDYGDFPKNNGLTTEIWVIGGDQYASWTRTWTVDNDFDPEDDDGPEMGYDLDPACDFQCFDLPPEAHYGSMP